MPDPGHCQGYALKNWVEGLSDEAYYPWESPNKRKFGFFDKK